MDQRLFFLINRQWTSPVLDRIMAAASSLDLWLPFLAVLVVVAAWRGRARARWLLAGAGPDAGRGRRAGRPGRSST